MKPRKFYRKESVRVTLMICFGFMISWWFMVSRKESNIPCFRKRYWNKVFERLSVLTSKIRRDDGLTCWTIINGGEASILH